MTNPLRIKRLAERYGLRATGYGLRATGYGLRATGYGIRTKNDHHDGRVLPL